jgi:hypothetical protein
MTGGTAGLIRYWEIDHKAAMAEVKRPYRIELVGVTCDAGLAVARGIWRKLRTGRSVPIPSQLRSHRLFSENFERLAHLVDSATLYHTGALPCTALPARPAKAQLPAHPSLVYPATVRCSIHGAPVWRSVCQVFVLAIRF